MFRKRSWIIGTIAQLLLIVIILPIIMKLLSLFVNFESMAEKANSFVFSLIGSIPCFSTWFSMIVKYFSLPTGDKMDTLEKLVSNSNIITNGISIAKTFFQAVLTALIAKIFKAIHKFVSGNGAPIISTFSAVLVTTVLNYFLLKNTTIQSVILWYGGVIAIMFIGFAIMFRSIFATLRMRKSTFVLDLIISGISSVITAGYLTVMIFAVNGYLGTISTTIQYCIIITIIEMINLIACTLISLAYDRDKEKGIIS